VFTFDIGGSLALAAMSSRGFQLIGKACWDMSTFQYLREACDDARCIYFREIVFTSVSCITIYRDWWFVTCFD